jgi:predicted MFS family arabinose efflux permease
MGSCSLSASVRIASLLRLAIVRRLVGGVVLGGLSIGLAPLGLVLFVRDSAGSFAAAGAVLGAFGLGRAIATPAQGRLLDRLGPRRVLLPSSLVYAGAMLGLLAAGLADSAVIVLVAAAAVAGIAFPPLPALLRASWPRVAGDDEDALRAAYALDAIVTEVLFFLGLAVAAVLVALGRPAVIVAVMAVTAVVGCAILLTAPTPQAPERSPPDVARSPAGLAGPLAIAPLRLALALWIPVGFCLAVFEVIAPAFAIAHGHPWAGGMLLALTGAGNIAGAMWIAREGAAHDDRRVLVVAAVLLAAALALAALPSAFAAMGVVAVLVGAPHGPFVVASGKLAADVSPREMLTETFTWSTTSIMIGGSAGGACAGALVDAIGWSAAALVSAAAAAAASVLLGTALVRRSRILTGARSVSDPDS